MGNIRYRYFNKSYLQYYFFPKVDLCIEPGQSLGLMIRGGLEYSLGIYITGVDKDSVADRAGLMVSEILNRNVGIMFGLLYGNAVVRGAPKSVHIWKCKCTYANFSSVFMTIMILQGYYRVKRIPSALIV